MYHNFKDRSSRMQSESLLSCFAEAKSIFEATPQSSFCLLTLQRSEKYQYGVYNDFEIVYFAHQSYISAFIESDFSNFSATNNCR